jgi:toxin ParE1/3/4
MRLNITPAALADIAEIDEYLTARSLTGAENVQISIDKALQLIVQCPNAGRQQRSRTIRKIGTTGYPYLIYDRVEAKLDEVVVMSVLHSSRRRKFEDA